VRNFKSFKKEFLKQLKKHKKLMIITILISALFLFFGFVQRLSFILGVLIFFTFYLYLYSKAIDESCMVRRIKTSNLREGDWLYSNLKIGKKVINAKWEGVNKKDIKEITKKYKEIKIRQGIPFSPVFLISFIIFVILIVLKINLWNPFW
jgi:Ca2+/Na+ antiporter